MPLGWECSGGVGIIHLDTEETIMMGGIISLILDSLASHGSRRHLMGTCDMTKTLDFHDNQPHKIAETICLKCLRRSVTVWPANLWLKSLECSCGEVGFIIKTGQELDDDSRN